MFNQRKFRLNIVPLIPAVALYGVGVSVVLGYFKVLWIPFGICLAVFGIIALFVCQRLLPIYVGPNGIRAQSVWFKYCDIPWIEIQRSKRILNGIWLLTERNGWITLPTLIEDRSEYKKYVLNHAPEHNALRRTLERIKW